MEDQLHTPKNSNNISKHEEKWMDSIKDNLYYISISLMILVNVLISLLHVENGYIGLNHPSSVMGWILWAGQIILATLIGVIILNLFRRQGIKNGQKKIKTIYEEYINATTINNKELKPRSLKEYLAKTTTKDTLSKSIIYISISLITGSLLISANWNNILSLIINIILAIGFGIKTMLQAEDYVCEELIVWYKQKIKELNKDKGDVENGKNI